MLQDTIEEFLDEESIQENELQVEEETAARKKRGKYFNSYSEDDLQKAIEEVKSGNVTAYAASQKYTIPISTIVKRVKGESSNVHGREQVLSAETEQSLVDWIVTCAKMGDPRTKDQLLTTAAECAKISLVGGKGFKNEIPTSYWLSGFIKRNPAVSFRTPSSLTRAAANVSQHNIISFLNNTREDLKKKLGDENYAALSDDPTAWGNSDETNFELNPVPSKVLATKGSKNVYRVETAKPKECISVMYTCLADGRYLRPQLIFKKSLSTLQAISWSAQQVGAQYAICQTANGWQTQESFFEYASGPFIENLDELGVVRTPEHPFVWYVDGHSSHHSYKLFTWCRENHIDLVIFVPYATNILQMCDLGIFGPLKKVYVKEVQDWKLLTGNRQLTELDFVQVLKTTNDKALKPQTIINGFRSTGTFPLNPGNVHLDRCIGAEPISEPPNEEESAPIEADESIALEVPTLAQEQFDLGWAEEPPWLQAGSSSLTVAANETDEGLRGLEGLNLSLAELQEGLDGVKTFCQSRSDVMLNVNVMRQQLTLMENFLNAETSVPPPTVSLQFEAPSLQQQTQQNVSEGIEKLLTPPAPFHRVGGRSYKMKNFGVMTTDKFLEQCQKQAAEKDEAEAAKVDRKNEREERKRQTAVLLNIKKEKNEERKAEKRKKNEETLQRKNQQEETDAPEVVKPKRGRPAKSSTPSAASKPVKPVANRCPKKK